MSTSKGCVNANTRSGVKIKKEYILILGLVLKITFNKKEFSVMINSY